MTSARAIRERNWGHVPKTILKRCVHSKRHLILLDVFIWTKTKRALWPWTPHPDPATSMSHYKPGFLSSRFILQLLSHPSSGDASHIASFSCSLLTGVESGVALCGMQPIQFKVKWCVLSEMSFCRLLLYRAVIYLWPVNLDKFCQSPLKASVKLSSPFHCFCLILLWSVKLKHGGIIFKS